jgi:serine/threonine-protein kinase
MREAEVAARIQHPNVVSVHEIETVGDEVQLVMQYVEGAALGSLIAMAARKDERIPTRVAVRILLDACRGLAAVHAEKGPDGRLLGLVHRDVSPQNILVGRDGVARLTDFGLARAVYAGAPSTTQGTLKGKLGYMAPEYVQKGEVDRAVDVFAMGVVAWETLAGLRLFRGDNEAQTLDRVLREEASPLAAIVPELAPLDPVLARATAKDPTRRFASALELEEALTLVVVPLGLLGTLAEVSTYVEVAVGADLALRRRVVSAAESAARSRFWPLLAGGSLAAAGLIAAGAALSKKAEAPKTLVPAASAPTEATVPSIGETSRPLPELPSAAPPPAAHPSARARPSPSRPPQDVPSLPPNPYDRRQGR